MSKAYAYANYDELEERSYLEWIWIQLRYPHRYELEKGLLAFITALRGFEDVLEETERDYALNMDEYEKDLKRLQETEQRLEEAVTRKLQKRLEQNPRLVLDENAVNAVVARDERLTRDKSLADNLQRTTRNLLSQVGRIKANRDLFDDRISRINDAIGEVTAALRVGRINESMKHIQDLNIDELAGKIRENYTQMMNDTHTMIKQTNQITIPARAAQNQIEQQAKATTSRGTTTTKSLATNVLSRLRQQKEAA